MAITSLISPSGMVISRPIEAFRPVTIPQTEDARQTARAARQPRDLSRGLGPEQRKRIHLDASAKRLNEYVQAQEARRSVENVATRLGRAETTLRQVRNFAELADSFEAPDAARSDMEATARELASSLGAEFEVSGNNSGPEIATLPGFGFQPGTLGMVGIERSAEDESSSMGDLRREVDAVTPRVVAERRRVEERLERMPLPEFESALASIEEDVEPERIRLLTEDEARQVADEVREEVRTNNGSPLIHQIVPLTAETVLALIP
ncbi:MAG: hypothetical protein O3A46_11705 [Candidatus Poribacteria bacterium]|nr:hypothetical protein [Candidatus Poribacteria bacterium]